MPSAREGRSGHRSTAWGGLLVGWLGWLGWLGCLALASCAEAPRGPAQSEAGPGVTPTAATEAAWRRLPAPPDLDLDQPLVAGFLIVDGVYNSELMAPYDIFHHTPFHTEPRPGIEVFTVSPDGAAVTSFEGLVIQPHHSFETAPPIDILVVPSAEHSMDEDLENRRMMEWVQRVGSEARWVVSLCDGAFVLAEAGLLQGREATTFPGDQDAFAQRFPDIVLRRGVSFVHDGPAITSEGGAKSYDPAMYLVDHLYGETVATNVGRGLIIDWPPQSGRMPVRLVD